MVAVVLAETYLSRSAFPSYNRLYPYVMFRPHENDAYVSHETFAISLDTGWVHHYTNAEGFRVSSPDYKVAKTICGRRRNTRDIKPKDASWRN